MLESGIKLKKILLFMGDIALLYFSLWLTLLIRYWNANNFFSHLLPFSIVFIIFLIIFYIDDLYEVDFGKNRAEIISKLIRSIAIGTIISSTFFYFGYNRLFSIRPQRVLLIEVFIILVLLFLWRYFFYYFITSPKLSKNTLCIGSGSVAEEIIKKLLSRPQLGFRILAILDPEKKYTEIPDVYLFSDERKIREICERKKIDTIILSDKLKQDKNILKSILECLSLNISVYELSDFYEKLTGKVPVDFIGHVWFLENLRGGARKPYETLKRISDVSISLFLLLLSLPFIPIIISAIKIDSKGPIFFKQIRTGKNGREFLAMKFRTMYANSEKSGPQWAKKDDPRVTRIGKFFRKLRIDEIPQLLNILRGEMSLIGPRPERPEFIHELQEKIPFYMERLLVKPGLTGWAQVMGPSYGGSFEETLDKVQYDLYYIKNRSVGLDISILLKTIKTVASAKGQ